MPRRRPPRRSSTHPARADRLSRPPCQPSRQPARYAGRRRAAAPGRGDGEGKWHVHRRRRHHDRAGRRRRGRRRRRREPRRVTTAAPTVRRGGEGPADGGANPGGHDGGADGSAGGEGTADGGANPGRSRRRRRRFGVVDAAERGPEARPALSPVHRHPGRAVRRRATGGARRCSRAPASCRRRLRRPVQRPRPSTSWSPVAACAPRSSAWRARATVLPPPRTRPPAASAPRSATRSRATRCSIDSPTGRPSCCRACTACGRRSSTSPASSSTTSAIRRRSTPTSRRPSSQGFDPHYDTHDVFVLQVSGREALAHPRARARRPARARSRGATTARRSRAPPTSAPAIDAVLRPGDALYLPRGWIHSATALGDATSVHLTVGMSAYTRADVVDALLARVGDDARLRASLPLGVDLGDTEAFARDPRGDGRRARRDSRSRRMPRHGRRRSQRRFDGDIRAEPVAPLATLEALATPRRVDAGALARIAARSRIETVDDRVRIVSRAKTLSLPVEAEAGRATARRRARPIAVGSCPASTPRAPSSSSRRLRARGIRGGARVTLAVEHWAPELGAVQRSRESGTTRSSAPAPAACAGSCIEVAASWGPNALLDAPFDRDARPRARAPRRGRRHAAARDPPTRAGARRRRRSAGRSSIRARGSEAVVWGEVDGCRGGCSTCRSTARPARRRTQPVYCGLRPRTARPVLRRARPPGRDRARRSAPRARPGSARTSAATGSPARWSCSRTGSTTATPTTATRRASPTPSTTGGS